MDAQFISRFTGDGVLTACSRAFKQACLEIDTRLNTTTCEASSIELCEAGTPRPAMKGSSRARARRDKGSLPSFPSSPVIQYHLSVIGGPGGHVMTGSLSLSLLKYRGYPSLLHLVRLPVIHNAAATGVVRGPCGPCALRGAWFYGGCILYGSRGCRSHSLTLSARERQSRWRGVARRRASGGAKMDRMPPLITRVCTQTNNRPEALRPRPPGGSAGHTALAQFLHSRQPWVSGASLGRGGGGGD